MIFLRLLLVVLLAGPFAASAQEKVRKSDVVRLLQKLQTEQNNPQALRAAGFEGEKLKLMLDHGTKLANNQTILEHMADQLINARNAPTPTNPVGGLLAPLLDRGMPYMPVSEQIYHMKVELTVMQAMSTANCGRSVKDTIAPEVFGRALVQTMARLNAPALKEYLRIVRKASTLGVSRPNPPRIADAKREKVLEGFASALEVTAAEKGLSRAYARSDTDMRGLSNREACGLGLLFIETIIDTKGPNQKPLLQLFWRDFQ